MSSNSAAGRSKHGDERGEEDIPSHTFNVAMGKPCSKRKKLSHGERVIIVFEDLHRMKMARAPHLGVLRKPRSSFPMALFDETFYHVSLLLESLSQGHC